ncbi:hypothetical protein C2S52_019668 [Perilla frutescens var. hirtella]|nr:hypothetical protein C2S52_019668 [Perilla frutescens var. hirtella]
MEHPTAYLEPVFYKMVEIDGPTQSLCLPCQFYHVAVIRLIFNSENYWTCELERAEERTESFSLMTGWTSFVSVAAIQPSEMIANSLRASTRSSYRIGRADHGRCPLCMTNGWTEFKEQNNIKWQDMLTFHHIGKDIIRVSIFGPDGCLKQHATPFNEQNGLEEAQTVWLQNTLGDLWEVPMTVVNNNWTPRYYLEKFEWVRFIIDNDIGEGAILLFKVKPNSIIKVEVLGYERGEAMLQQSIRGGLLRQ